MAKPTEDAAASVRVEIRPGALSKIAAAAYLAVSERTVERLIADGSLPTRRIRARTVILPGDLDAYLQSLPVAQ
jgi:excisionase family DNA binding protein